MASWWSIGACPIGSLCFIRSAHYRRQIQTDALPADPFLCGCAKCASRRQPDGLLTASFGARKLPNGFGLYDLAGWQGCLLSSLSSPKPDVPVSASFGRSASRPLRRSELQSPSPEAVVRSALAGRARSSNSAFGWQTGRRGLRSNLAVPIPDAAPRKQTFRREPQSAVPHQPAPSEREYRSSPSVVAMPTVFSQCRIRAVSPSTRASVMILVGSGTRDPFRGPLLHLRPRSAGVATRESQRMRG
jgi:hypothetical protein